MKLNFLDKLDTAIFKHVNPNHRPISGFIFWEAFIGSAIIALVVFVLQMCNISNKTIDILTAVALLGLVGWVFKRALLTLGAFSGWGGRIMYSLYLLFLIYLAFTIAMWMVLIALAGLFIYGIFKIFFSGGSSSPSRKSHQEEKPEDEYAGTVVDENGYERKLKDHGFGTYRDDKGDYWKRNSDGSVSRDNS